MLKKTYNEVVSCMHAATPAEAERLLARLPERIQSHLKADFSEVGEAYRYDAGSKAAYFFYPEKIGLVVWIWEFVRDHDEANKLFTLVAGREAPLTTKIANDLYARATKRSVTRPWK